MQVYPFVRGWWLRWYYPYMCGGKDVNQLIQEQGIDVVVDYELLLHILIVEYIRFPMI
ncbi:hypothetical protein J6TS7_17400 [Paenibacillus dendritiformis]|nr:hypothetical protein J6TS7_17400 [Paenibacillus dendritiformis]